MGVVELVYRAGRYEYARTSNRNKGPNPYGGIIRLVKIRNPWGKTEFEGKWGDNSHEMKMAGGLLAHDEADDGIFYMGINDFYNYFS